VSPQGSDWWESAVFRADLLVKDFAKIIHPENKHILGHDTRYFRDIYAKEAIITLSAEDCKTTYPICDPLVASYPITPICERYTYQV